MRLQVRPRAAASLNLRSGRRQKRMSSGRSVKDMVSVVVEGRKEGKKEKRR
jgi:hypothetical protein